MYNLISFLENESTVSDEVWFIGTQVETPVDNFIAAFSPCAVLFGAFWKMDLVCHFTT